MNSLRNCTNPFFFVFTYLSIALGFALTSTPAYSAWTQKAGHLFLSQSILQYTTSEFYDANGTRHAQLPFRKREWNGYMEYGWRDDLTLGANFSFQQLSADFIDVFPSLGLAIYGREYNYGLADTEFFVRKRIWQSSHAVLSLQPLIKLPSLYRFDNDLRGGTDNFDGEMQLQGGYGFDAFGQHHYTTLDIAYRKRMGEWHDQFKADATLGIGLTERFTLMPQMFYTQHLESSTIGGGNAATANDYDLLKAQLSAVYKWNDRVSFQLGAFSHLYARNTGGGEGALASIWYQF